MALGLLLAALLPTSGMTISWTGFAKGNMRAAINMTVIGMTLGFLLAPFYARVLLGATIEVDVFKIAQQIAIIVFIPMFIGQVTRKALLQRYQMKKFKELIVPRFPVLSTLGVLGIVFVAMALKAEGIMEDLHLLISALLIKVCQKNKKTGSVFYEKLRLPPRHLNALQFIMMPKEKRLGQLLMI